jgi:hypothetical protein
MQQIELEIKYDQIEHKVVHAMHDSGLFLDVELTDQMEIPFKYKLPKMVFDYREIMRLAQRMSAGLAQVWVFYRAFKSTYERFGLYRIVKTPQGYEREMIDIPSFVYFQE